MALGSKITWRDELLVNGKKQKGSERLKHPPEEIVKEIKQYAQAHDVEVASQFKAGAP